MILQRILTIPVFFSIEEGVIRRIPTLLKEHNFVFARPLLVSGPTATRRLAEDAAGQFGLDAANVFCVGSNAEEEVAGIRHQIEVTGADLVVAIGGGTIIDVGKVASQRQRVPFLSVPTTLSNDGIASPIAVIRSKSCRHESIGAHMPIGVIIDVDVVRRAPIETLRAGLGDLLSNMSAIQDWRYAHGCTTERIDSLALLLAQTAVDSVMGYLLGQVVSDLTDRMVLERVAEGLVLSGLAMAIAGSSRPCSGSEHLISHALDRVLPQSRAHGLQVALATLFMEHVRGHDVAPLLTVFQKFALPCTLGALDLDRDQFVEAVQRAPDMRPGRVTMLGLFRDTGQIRTAVEAFDRA